MTFHVFVTPFLRASLGHQMPLAPVIRATTRAELNSPAHLTHFFRVRLAPGTDGAECEPNGPQGSGLVRSLGLADGLAVVPEGTSQIAAGAPVDVLLLPGCTPPTPQGLQP